MTAIITSSGPSPATLSSQILGTTDPNNEISIPKYTFSFTPFLLKTYRHGLSPTQPICKAYMQGLCPLGNTCPDRHINTTRRGNWFINNGGRFGDDNSDMGGNLVCKHWLRGLCKKGEGCEFLHEYNLRKMPECTTFSRTGYCPNGDECLYLHIDAYTKESLLPCPHYSMGFCPLGPSCSKAHRRRKICQFYLAGFCPQGITHPPPPLPNSTSNSRDNKGDNRFEGFGGCDYGIHPKWIKESELPALKRKVVRSREEIEEERERRREEAEEREGADGGGGGGGGFRGRGGFYGGGGGGFRGGRGRGGFDGGGAGFRGRGRGRY